MKKNIFFVVFVLFANTNLAQYNCNIISDSIIYKRIKVGDSANIYIKLSNFVESFRSKGFVDASIDTIIFETDSEIKAIFHKGEKYYWKSLRISDNKFNSEIENLNKKAVNFIVLDDEIDKISNYYLQTGYPFISFYFDSLKIVGNNISTKINIDRGKYIVFDSIYFDDKKVNVSKTFLSNYLDFKKSNPYNDEIVNSIEEKILKLSFLDLTSKPEIEFHESSADLYLYLQSKKLSQVSGILGFTNVDGKYSLLGQADVKLVNTFRRADEIKLVWQKTKPKSQNLIFEFSIPYIFNTKIGVDNSLILNKFDTSYIDFSNKISLSYYFKGLNRVGVYSFVHRSIVIDSNSVFENFYINSYGLDLSFYELNNLFYPRKGWSMMVSSDLGQKNNYDTSTYRFSFNFDFSTYIVLFNNFIFHYRNYLKYFDGNQFYENELFKFGGAKLMRGFDEESLSANFLEISSFELRYVLDNWSDIFIFSDYAIFKHLTFESEYWQHPFSIGVGVNLSTKSGLFSLTYALGKVDNQSFIIKNSKIHIAYKTFF